jgi:ABC-2 type transport system ATP-binding protein
MIEVEELRKAYGDVVAVDGVSFTANAGEIFGLLGPNGAGKSTTIGCISGLLAPTAGRIRVRGHDVRSRSGGRAARAEVGFVPQEIALYEDLSARENLHYWGGAWGLSRARLRRRTDEVLEVCGLTDRAGTRVGAMSGGMKRRLNFSCGILHEPSVLLLDEPTAGVDPQSRVRLLDLVRAEAARGTCVLYTTHYMEEAEALCDRLAVVDHGRVVALGSLAELRAGVGERDLLRLSGRFAAAAVGATLARLDAVELVQCDDGLVVLAVADAARALPTVFAALAEVDADVRETTMTRPGLETLFIKLTGSDLRG